MIPFCLVVFLPCAPLLLEFSRIFFSIKSACDELSEPPVRSVRVLLLWQLMGDLFQRGPQTVHLRVSLCRIMQGQRVRSHAGVLSLLVKKNSFHLQASILNRPEAANMLSRIVGAQMFRKAGDGDFRWICFRRVGDSVAAQVN